MKRIEGVGTKLVPRARKRPLTDLEKAKAALGLSAAPTTLPCRDKYMLFQLFLISTLPNEFPSWHLIKVPMTFRSAVRQQKLPRSTLGSQF